MATLLPQYSHFLDLADFSADDIRAILNHGKAMKARRRKPGSEADKFLNGKVIAMIFEQPSLRTRMSFDVAIRDMGGEPLMVTGKEIELGERESIADTARVLSRYLDGVMIRILSHAALKELAEYASIPIINGLTKTSHPCQVMADIMTYEEHRGPIEGAKIAWLGDSNNVLTSWIEAAARLKFTISVATPEALQPSETLVAWARSEGAIINLTRKPEEAVADASCLITDCWVSMGDTDKEYRHNLLKPYQVNQRLMQAAGKDAVFMHCLPAKRGEEVTADVMDGPQSLVFDEAENRLHAQKGVLAWSFGARQ